jgi:predicted nucleic acid-binding protein
MSAGARYLVDTNVLVFAGDESEPVKRPRALSVIDRLAAARVGIVTTQVLAEYFVTVTRRFSETLPVDAAASRLEGWAGTFEVLGVTLPVVGEAARAVERYGMPYWDAQIWASARLAGIGTVLTEDLPGQPEIEGVRFVDPFADGFELEI